MGSGMARQLLAKGCGVIGYDPEEQALSSFVEAGGKRAESVREVADHATIVFASLPTIVICNEVALGEDGVIAGSAVKIYVETSTIGPKEAKRLAEEMHKIGNIVFLDAPVSGGIDGADKGTLTTIVGGERAAFDLVNPFLQKIATHIVYAGETPGLGQLYKVINNYIVMNSLAITCEAVAIGVQAGGDEALLIDVVNHSTGRNFATSVYFPTVILPRVSVPSLRMAAKDVRLFVELAEKYGQPSACGTSVLERWEAAAEGGLNMVQWYEAMLQGEPCRR
jgi:3-hydroxyisobutyrate dehydrogenase-like beta-hydroxyacid dehydrogenase